MLARTLLILYFTSIASPQHPAPMEHKAASRLDSTIWAGFVSGQDLRVLLVETTWHANRFLSFAPAYANISSPAATSHQLRGSATASVTLGRFVLDDRSLFVRHWAPGRDRLLYRNRLRLTYPFKAFGNKAALFVADEPFYDWRQKAWTRNWVYAGGSVDLARHLTAQVFYLRQDHFGGAGVNTMVYALLVHLPGIVGFKKG